MRNALFLLLPEEALPLLLVAGGFAMMLGFRKAGVGLIVGVILMALLGPFVECFIEALPPELFWPAMVVFALMIFRAIFGRRVTENVLSFMIWELIRFPFRFLAWLFRGPRPR